jgi:aryl-alcohol dehydrogenase-like predicted oxidoreductase
VQYRKLGSSNLEVSIISFGAWQIGDSQYWGVEEQADAEATVAAALDAGINLFDTAEMYGSGESERVLGRALGSKRDSVTIASKVWPDKCSPALLRKTCEESLRRLNTDAIDLYQIHWPPRDVPFADVYATLAALRDEGKIRMIGVSNFGATDLAEWMSVGECVSDQLGYNILFRAIEHEIVPACQHYGVGILAYLPLMQGLLAGRWDKAGDMPVPRRRSRHFAGTREGTRHGEPGCEDLTFEAVSRIRNVANRLEQPMANVSLAWLMAQPGVTSVIVGARRADQLRRNLEAVNLLLSEETLKELDSISQPLKDYFGLNADLWLSENDRRVR